MNEIMIAEPLAGLEQSKASQIEGIFAPMVNMLKEFEGQYAEVMAEEPSDESCKRAKRLRLDIAKIRVMADKERKSLKEEYLRGGNAVQGVYNILKFAVVEKEEKLKERETHFERMEADKVKSLQADREEELSKYDIDGSLMRLGEMDALVWSNFLAGTKTNWETQREAERKAEEQRIEREEKNRVLNSRIREMLPLNGFYDHSLLTIDLTDDAYNELHELAVSGKAAHEEEQKRIREENARLRKEQEEAEEARKADEARKKEEARLAAMAPEKEKLQNIAGDLIKQVYNFDSFEAQDAINKAVRILQDAAEAL